MSLTSDYPIIALGSLAMMSRQRSEADTEAALSLCALGGTTSTYFVDGYTNLHPSVHSKTWVIDAAVPVTPIGAITIIAQAGSSSIHKLTSGCSALSMGESVLSQDDSKQLSTGSNHIDKKKKAAAIVTPQRKNNMKPRDSKRDTSVSFEEMQRIMQVYGPIKSGRNQRKINHIGKMVKPESIKRKFYRWFPDFNERFIKAPDGFFTPKIGHQQEIEYREVMRTMDQELLVKKRSNTRYLPPMYHEKTYFY